MTGCQWRSDWHTRERPVSASPRQKGRQNNNQEGGERNTEREGGGELRGESYMMFCHKLDLTGNTTVSFRKTDGTTN